MFVSSEMRSKRLAAERVAAAEAAEELGVHFAWYWERDANAGPYSSENVCLGQARTSDCLVLILGETLTDITRREYLEARDAGAGCFIFTKVGCVRDGDAALFISQQRDVENVITKSFETVADLRTGVVRSLVMYAAQAQRRYQLALTPSIASRRGRSDWEEV